MRDLVLAVIRRELLLALRRPVEILLPPAFFILIVSLYPLGIGPDSILLRRLASGIVWVAALLSTLLSLPRLFAGDWRDGTLAQLVLAPQPLPIVVLAKLVAHWVLAGLPLVILVPLLGLQFDLSGAAVCRMTVALAVGTPALSAIGAIGAALTLGLRGGGVLLSLLILPLYTPVLILGSGAMSGGPGDGVSLALLGALTLASGVLAPCAVAAALRMALE